MMRIAYIIPGIGLKEEESIRRKNIANKIVSEKTVVDLISATQGPYSIENRVEEVYASSSYLSLIHKLSDSYDAFVIGCFGDPGVRGARELTCKPVVGPAEASLHVASQLADRIAIMSPLKSTVKLTMDIVEAYGFKDRVVVIEPVEVSVLEMARDYMKAVNMIADKIENVINKSDVEAVILGCMSMGFALIDEALRDRVDIPIINPVKISLKMAEMFAYLGLSHSRRTYPPANVNKIMHLLV